MDYDNFLELVKNRRSIRRFKPDPIPDEYIEKIIEAACWAPSGYNSQPWDFVVVKDKQLRDRIASMLDRHKNLEARIKATDDEERQRQMAYPWRDEEMDFRIAPVYIIICADQRAKIALPDMGKTDPAFSQSLFVQSLTCAFVYMLQAATTLGMATQWISNVGRPDTSSQLKELLGIPDKLEPYFMMPAGYPAYKPRPKLLRPKDKMIHYNCCAKEDFRTDKEVIDFARKTWIWTTATHRRGVDKIIE